MELQARRNRGGRVISWFGRMAESISFKPCETNPSKWPPNGHLQQQK
jgi:hypothetical protein